MLFRPKFIIALLLTLGMLAVGQPESGWTQSKRPAIYEFGAGYCISCKEMEKVMARA